jgi:hypothetical protein
MARLLGLLLQHFDSDIDGSLLLDPDPALSAQQRIGYILFCVFLVVFSGLMAGLTLGLLSLDR